jgi:PKD repeat protein
MRKLGLTTLFVALAIGCETKNPVGPGNVTLSQSTSTTSSTTTSTVPPRTTASFVFSPAAPAALQLVSFNAFGSTAAPGRTLVSYDWDFGDGHKENGMAVTHDFFPEGLYVVTLTVVDNAGEVATVSQPVGAGVPLPSSTTTSIPTTTAVRYVAAQADPDIPSDLTLFFQLLTGQSAVASLRTGLTGLRFGGARFAAVGDATYTVQGTYSTQNGKTGTIQGQMVGTLVPAPTGTFTGTLTASIQGCSASRPFSGPLSTASLQWRPAGAGSNTCQDNPLDFSAMNLQKSDAPAPAGPPSTTTTSIPCTYSLNPVSTTVESSGGNRTVAISTAPGCGWTMQTSTSWITLQAPTSGSGPANVSFRIAAHSTDDGQNRTGSVVIAGITFLVVQNAPEDGEQPVTTTTIPTTSTIPTTTTIPTTSTISTTTTIPTTSTISTTTTIPTTSTISTTTTIPTTSTISTTTTIPTTSSTIISTTTTIPPIVDFR